nr:hypothetical protein [Candidatus Sigynarchaeota archaeon]
MLATIPSFQDEQPRAAHACYECGAEASLEEILLVDALIELSPFLVGVSENFSHCSGDDDVFHDNIVNCCAGCFAQMIQSMASHDADGRKYQISSLASMLRDKPAIPASAIITLERLLLSLVTMEKAWIMPEPVLIEALYCSSSPFKAMLDELGEPIAEI